MRNTPLACIMTDNGAVAFTQARKILVVAPHPDDESLGCGGLISLSAQIGSSFFIVFVTDGAASHPNSTAWPPARLAAQREHEACHALACLGLENAPRLFLRLPDTNMPAPEEAAWQAAAAALRDVLQRFAPDLAILPWRRDPHCDHRGSWLLAQHALQQASLHPEILEYAIWLDEFGDREDHPVSGEVELIRVDISDVVARKRAAVAEHLSQTTDLIADDPGGFRLTPQTITRLTQSTEVYLRPLQ
jgi:LmbE family N-acetylglucosaminyl deacetylase